MRVVSLAWSVLLGSLVATAPLAAQQAPHESDVVTGAEIDAALGAHGAAADADRAAVRRTLERPEVARVARQMGIDPAAANAAVSSLEGEPLARAVSASADVEHALAGGDTFTINATTLIVVLLVIIIVILIAE